MKTADELVRSARAQIDSVRPFDAAVLAHALDARVTVSHLMLSTVARLFRGLPAAAHCTSSATPSARPADESATPKLMGAANRSKPCWQTTALTSRTFGRICACHGGFEPLTGHEHDFAARCNC